MRGRWILLTLMAVAAIGQAQVGNLEFCTVTGKVTDLEGEPVPGIKVEIRPATPTASSIPQSELGMTADALPDEQMRDPGRDSEIFAWGTTDGKGRYEIRGVPKPGAYMLIVRNLDDYQRVVLGTSEVFSTGSQAQYPPQPSSS